MRRGNFGQHVVLQEAKSTYWSVLDSLHTPAPSIVAEHVGATYLSISKHSFHNHQPDWRYKPLVDRLMNVILFFMPFNKKGLPVVELGPET